MALTRLLIFICASLLTGINASNQKFVSNFGDSVVHDEYLVVLQTGITQESVEHVIQSLHSKGGVLAQKYVIGKNTILRAQGAQEVLEKLSLEPYVKVVEPNRIAHLERPIVESLPKTTPKLHVKEAAGK